MKTQKPKTIADFKVAGRPLLSAKHPLENGSETTLFNGHSIEGKSPEPIVLTIWKDGLPTSLEMDAYGLEMLADSIQKARRLKHPGFSHLDRQTKKWRRSMQKYLMHSLSSLSSAGGLASDSTKNGIVPGNDCARKWLPIAKNQRVRGLDAFRNMAKRNGVRFDEQDFRHGEILTVPGDDYAVRLGGIAGDFVHCLSQLDDGSLSRDEFFHRFPFVTVCLP